MIILVTILEIFYLSFMFIYFKTRISINHPLEYVITNKMGNYFEHPISDCEYSNKICPFGKMAIKILIIYLILRLLVIKSNYFYFNYLKKLNIFILIVALILSLMNMNALLYLIPFIFLEVFLLKNKFLIKIEI